MKLSDLQPRVIRLLGIDPVESERDLQRKRDWYARNRAEQRQKARDRWGKRNANTQTPGARAPSCESETV